MLLMMLISKSLTPSPLLLMLGIAPSQLRDRVAGGERTSLSQHTLAQRHRLQITCARSCHTCWQTRDHDAFGRSGPVP